MLHRYSSKYLPIVCFFTIIMTACGTQERMRSQNNGMTFPAPDIIKNALITGLQAEFYISGMGTYPMTINPADSSATVHVDNVPQGSHTFTITYFVMQSLIKVILAQGSNTASVVAGQNINIGISTFDMSMDDDNDGVSNVLEIINDIDPEESDKPTWQIEPSNITINGGSVYYQTNGTAQMADLHNLTCSPNGTSCVFGVDVEGAGGWYGTPCYIHFTAPIPAQTCNLRVIASDNGFPSFTVGKTISIVVRNHVPTWQTVPANITISGGSIYNQTNGIATDVDTGQTMSCSNISNDCVFAVTASGSGANPQNCNINFTAPLLAGTCNLRIMNSDNQSPPLTIGQTITISVVKTWSEIGNGSASGGGISNNNGDSQIPSLKIDSTGTPVVAWYDRSSGKNEIYIKSWNGSVWAEIGTGSASDGGISSSSIGAGRPSLALDSTGNPVVAWSDQASGNSEIYIKRWNGSAWQEVGTGSASGGGITNNSGVSNFPSLFLDSSGNPVAVWMDNSSGKFQIYIKRWNGSGWVGYLGGSADYTGGGISNSSGFNGAIDRSTLALDSSGNPVVAWDDDSSGKVQIYIKRWNGSGWVGYLGGSADYTGGGISNSSVGAASPYLALDSTGNPVVAWSDQASGNSEIYIKRWNGSAWVVVGTGSASGGGISNNSNSSYCPSLALDSSGNPVVAWSDGSSGKSEIYIKRWTGSAWVEMGNDSASGGGISNSSGFYGADISALALDSSGNPAVTWRDDSSGNYEIFIKRWQP